jgi:hypothetical protein
MKTNWRFVCLMVLSGFFVCVAAWAQDKAPEATETKEEEAVKFDPAQMADFSDRVATLSQMVSLAQSNMDALMMIGAVRVLDSLPFEGVEKPGTDKASKDQYDRKDMLNKAKEFASEDKEILAVIAKLEEVPETTAVRGRHGRHGRRGRGPWHGKWNPHAGWFPGHRPPPGFYVGPGYPPPPMPYPCRWFQKCGPWGCRWICG